MNENLQPVIEEKKPKKKAFLIVGIAAGVLILVAAAFFAGRLLNGQGTGLMFPFGNGIGSVLSNSIILEPAPEIPTTEAEVIGTFAERKDNTIFVEEFSMSAEGGGVAVSVIGGDESGSGSGESTTSNPKVEIVASKNTLIYADVTSWDQLQNEVESIQQVVELSSLENITPQAFVEVWGRKVGDRVIADVIVFTNPMSFENQE